jgi:hypothetical protein
LRFPDFDPEPAFVGEEMIAMTHIPRVRLILVLAALLALLVVPMTGARPLSSPSLHSADGSWLGAALRWVDDFFVPHHGHVGSQVPPGQKEDPQANKPQGGGCVGPDGHIKPACL